MPQLSKKDQIAHAALAVFLERGIKGTSVDIVVKISKVSKPTIYNHFPDKAMLFAHVVSCWLNNQPNPNFRARTVTGLKKELSQNWLSNDALRLYSLLMSEGFRAPDAKLVFKDQFDTPWREALTQWADTYQEDASQLNNIVDSQIFRSLF